ncbi:MAG TPA: flagellar basal body rod protein FlgB [Thermodesulfobacteriota bacterium]
MTDGIFDKTIGLLGNAMDLRASRHKLLSSNIANQETPGYRAVDINFESELKKRADVSSTDVYLAGTNGRHLATGTGTSYNAPAVLDRATDLPGYDANSVGIEAEMSRLSENTLMYTVASKMLKSKFNLLMTAIKEGGR